MAQSAFSSRILDANRVALAAVDTDVWVFNKGTPYIVATALQMDGGTNLLATDLYSHSWYYPGWPGTFDIDEISDVGNNAPTVLATGLPVLTGANKRCTTNGSSVDAGREFEATGGSSSALPAVDCNSGSNFESQVAVNLTKVRDRDGIVVQFGMRTAIALGGDAETFFLAKLRFPKPHAKPVAKFPMPRLRAGVVGRR